MCSLECEESCAKNKIVQRMCEEERDERGKVDRVENQFLQLE